MKYSDICIFTRSYRGDREFLPFLYESIDRYCGNWGEVVLVVEESDFDAIREYVPSWVRIEKEDTFAPGAIQQKYSKITADLHTKRDFVFHIDSDSVFTKAASLDDLASDGKPFLEYSSYDHLLKYQTGERGVEELRDYCIRNTLPTELAIELKKAGVKDCDSWMKDHFQSWLDSHFETWFANFFKRWKQSFGVDIWREGTESALGCPVDHEFSRRPEKLYPRNLYAAARNHIETTKNVSFKEFIKSRVGRQQNGLLKSQYFSDLNFLGAYLYNFMYSEIEWVDVETQGYNFRDSFVKQFISFDLLADGVLKPGAQDVIRAAMEGVPV